MPLFVVDASVTFKWLAPERGEPGTDEAVALFEAFSSGACDFLHPSHWIADVLAPALRQLPASRLAHLRALAALAVPIEDSFATLSRATELSVSLSHHLFDTLYHAVALERGATLVTADAHYFRKASRLGNISLLGDWPKQTLQTIH